MVEAGVGRRDSNVIGVAYRELIVTKHCLESLLAEAKEEAKLQVEVLLCLPGKRSFPADLQGHRCHHAPLGGSPGSRKPRRLTCLPLLRKIVVWWRSFMTWAALLSCLLDCRKDSM